MSINSSKSMNQTKVRRYGNLFGSIDFQLNNNLSVEVVKRNPADAPVGEFQISGKSYPVTMAEIDRIIETAEAAKAVFFKKYSMGGFNY